MVNLSQFVGNREDNTCIILENDKDVNNNAFVVITVFALMTHTGLHIFKVVTSYYE